MTANALPGGSPPARQPRRSVSLFWPIILIGIGVGFLLDNAGLIVGNPLSLVALYWPVLLIVAGIDIIFSRTGWLGTLISALVGVAVAGGGLYAMTTPGLANTPPETLFVRSAGTHTERVAYPLEGIRTARIDLNLRAGSARLQGLVDSPDLVDATVELAGRLVDTIERSGDSATVRLDTRPIAGNIFVLDWLLNRWDVRLSPRPTLDLHLNVDSGTLNADLTALTLREVGLTQNSGSSTLRLPEGGQYRLGLVVNSGSADVRLPPGLPAQVRYNVNSGALSTSLTRVNGNARNGVYETPNFSQAGSYALIDIQLNSGGITIR